MYTVEERMKAVKKYMECGFREGPVIAALGYPSPNTLRNWYREYVETGSLREKSAPKLRYSSERQTAEVKYIVEHPWITLTRACVELGYPTRGILNRWIQEQQPELRCRNSSSCQRKRGRVKIHARSKTG